MSSYKLVQFLKNYINLEGVEVPIEIYLCTTQSVLNKLDYKYKDICKNIFIDKQEQHDMIENYANFLKAIKDLKLYIVKFKKDRIMKLKVYPNDCIVKDSNERPIIVNTHDEYIYSADNSV